LASQNETLEQQVTERTAALKLSLDELKSTQEQLIQREKMASLGELTAGIAHEIQNPLNFVNNFSEVSSELVEELRVGPFLRLSEGDRKEAGDILEDLGQNIFRIHHHGQRADAIVKNMLLHSRANTGQKEPTDINALADEYLRLAYYGLRAKDKGFNANLVTEFDISIGKVEVVPQDLGRVLLNLFHNAFYATQEKKSQLNGQYQPEVKVTTNRLDGRIEIKVRDNGTGIPENVKGKIFQPFFTTKPTGQGTGLGLSLSYDIITKGHGGELSVASEQGEWAEFTITLLNVPTAIEPNLQEAPYKT
jgi:signal transduction histidine kinase